MRTRESEQKIKVREEEGSLKMEKEKNKKLDKKLDKKKDEKFHKRDEKLREREDEKLDKKEESEKTFPCRPRNLPDSHPGPHPTYELAISRAHLPWHSFGDNKFYI